MKKILVVLSFCLGAFVATAQPEIYLEDNTADPGEEICIPVRGRFFTDIVTIQFSVNFDPEKLTFNSVGNFGIGSMTNGNFDLSQAADGSIVFSWEDSRNCQSTNGGNPSFTIPNDGVLFEICFTANGAAGYGDVAVVDITDNPTPIVVERIGSYSPQFGCTNLGFLNIDPGLVSISVRPVQVVISDVNESSGKTACVNFSVTGFDNLQSMQFNVVWDSTIMVLDYVVPNGEIPNNGISNFGYGGNILADRLTYSWSYTLDEGVTEPDDTQLFQACFTLLDDSCDKTSPVSIVSYPTLGIEVTNQEMEGFNIFFESNEGTVQVNDCDPEGVQINVNCGDPVNLNDEVCVKVQAGNNYNSVTDLEFLLKWNPTILQYKEIRNTAQYWNDDNFVETNTAGGVLGVAWENNPFPPQTLNSGAVIFEVCFDVVGLGGNSPINISTPWRGRLGNGPNIGVNPTNCEVEVNQPSGVTMVIQDGAAGPGDPFCVDMNVSGFENITGLEFSLGFDPGLFQFVDVGDVNIGGGADRFNFITSGADAGLIYFKWDSATPVTLPDQSTAFQLCFTPLGSPGDCAPLEVVNLPFQEKATDVNSNGENIGLEIVSGEMCTLFPDGFGLQIAEVEGDWLDTACVSVGVVEFSDISAANFCISWDPSGLEYTGINFSGAWPGLTEANIDASSAGVGLLCIDWNGGSPTAIPDESTVFDLCFKMIGPALECYDIVMVEDPVPAVTTANGPGSIIPENGSICVNDKFYIIDTAIVAASCLGMCDGSVELTVIGGQGQLSTIWYTSPNNQFSPLRAQNLCAGPVTFRISDSSSPSLVEEFTIEIPLADGIPVSNAGEDKLLGCNPQSILLSGTGSEGNFSYEWYRITNNGQKVSIGTNRSVVEFVPGTKVFEVTNNETSCTAADTMFVTAPEVPVADAGEDLDFTCMDDGIQLDGSGSATGQNIVYSWRSTNNGVIAAGQESLINPRIEGPGSYILKVAYQETGCFSSDTVRVRDATVVPDVVAGQDQVLDCGVGTVTLRSLSNNPDLDITYEWYDLNDQLLGTGETVAVDKTGLYYLLARENTSNCASADTVMVLPDENYPVVEIVPPLDFTCARDSVMLSATVGPDTLDYTFNWAVADGGQFVPDTDTSLNPVALSPGLYTLAVTNTATGCTAEVDILLSEDLTPPAALAGTDLVITCQETSVTLTGPGSDVGVDFSYLWTNMEGDTVGTDLITEVSSPGTYTLQVTSLINGCTATDDLQVTVDEDVPFVTIAGAEDITCLVSSVSLSGTVGPAGPAYDLQWYRMLEDGNASATGDGTATLQVTQEGIYILEATNPADGCKGSNQVVVNLRDQAPVAEAGETTQLITCDEPFLTLSAAASSQGPEITYEWSNIAPPTNTGQTVEVDVPGMYELTVLNTETGCSATDVVEVVDGLQAPGINISTTDPALDCINSSLEIEAIVDGATDFAVTWKGLDGGTPSPDDSLATTITQPGNYRLIVSNNLTGCVDSLEFNVVDNSANPPVVSIAEPVPFTCTTPTIALDASATGNAADFSSISWASLDGNTVNPATGSLQVNVDGPGVYTLTVVDANTGCSAIDSVTVAPDNDTPVAMAGEDLGIECNETGVLDGTGSSQGPQFTYQWVNLAGNGDAMPPNDLEAAVSVASDYLLIVTNSDNGCVDTDTVTVNQIYPPDASAGMDISLCQDQTSADLSANLPAGTTGLWTGQGTAVVENTTSENTPVNSLQSGPNVFTWTLSAPGCPDYSQSQVTVYIETAPIAVDDQLIVAGAQRSVSIDLAQNDVLTGVDEYSVVLMGAPEFGTIDSFNNGLVYYSVPRGFNGVTEISYEICSLDCDELCDTGTLRIAVSDEDYEPIIMNTITPNGDGMNDNLIFDILLFTPAEEFPDNEIIIFNRWGDIVFQQRPYNNDWNGLNSNGELLPQGTYYYILRLNLADGEIIRGDVTIIDSGGR